MYLVRSLRTFIGTNAERTAAGLESFLPGDEYIETDTSLIYIHNGMTWLLNSSAGSPGGSDTQIQFNDDGVFGGASSLIYDKTLGDFRILGDGNSHLFMLDYSTNSIGFGTNGAFGTIALFNPSGIIYNDDGQDVDFRVESNNYSNIFKIDAGLDAVQIGTAAAGTIADFSSAGIVFNEEGENRDFRIEGDTATNLFIADAGLDAVRIGTTIAGALLDVAPTGIIFNNAEADVDLRIAGDSVTNGVYWDAGNSRLGLGTNAPDQLLHVAGNAAVVGYLNVNTTSNPPAGNLGVIHCYGVAPGFFFYEQGTTDNNVFFVYDAGLMQFQNRTDAGGFTSSPFVFDMTSATNTFRVNSSRVGIGTDPTNVSAKLEISSTTGAVLLPRMTTTQQNALTAVNGMLIYNSTTGKFTGYAGGAWVALH